MIVKECPSCCFLIACETRGNMTGQTLARGSKFSQPEEMQPCAGWGRLLTLWWVTAGIMSLKHSKPHMREAQKLKSWGKSYYRAKKHLGMTSQKTNTLEKNGRPRIIWIITARILIHFLTPLHVKSDFLFGNWMNCNSKEFNTIIF